MKVESFVDTRFGFPVVLLNVELKVIRGEQVPLVDANLLRRSVVAALVLKPGRLTGYEARFLRLWMNLSVSRLAENFGLTHPAILKWEAKEGKPTLMSKPTELAFRLLALAHLAQDFSLKELKESKVLQILQERIPLDSAGPQAFKHMFDTLSDTLSQDTSPHPVMFAV